MVVTREKYKVRLYLSELYGEELEVTGVYRVIDKQKRILIEDVHDLEGRFIANHLWLKTNPEFYHYLVGMKLQRGSKIRLKGYVGTYKRRYKDEGGRVRVTSSDEYTLKKITLVSSTIFENSEKFVRPAELYFYSIIAINNGDEFELGKLQKYADALGYAKQASKKGKVKVRPANGESRLKAWVGRLTKQHG
ncbi:hypothetical protein [Periweissella beninensis]|uniref:Uncharacterized protein n=1 Tax=Periweissella beninensis TaxID=504936 RepID=A0ABT0VLZ1_9LACO|nr:hypothetical protein [Periweissella beninensis]MBM7544095.1 hypothetical protein [Periweissella beninensis]MCM2437530.1 hypothetical protein [Periweissella beninensis]MCT4396543.1 hypothetical protein [Periweissella beninensis]